MKHPYNETCACARCTKERIRRTSQSAYDALTYPSRVRQAARRRRPPVSRRPIVGSAEWAETRGDDIGLSED